MKRLFAVIVLVFTLSIPVTMQAAEGFYIGGLGGVNFLDIDQKHINVDTETGYIFGGLLGYKWCGGFSAEFEASYRHNHINRVRFHHFPENHAHGHVQTWSFMANAYYDFDIDRWCGACLPVTPYVGAGLGYDREDVKLHVFGSGGSSHQNKFAWQLMAGLNYDLCWCGWDGALVNLEYKFHDADREEDIKAYNHAVTLGLKKFF